MFTVAADKGAAALRVRLSGHVSMADLNQQAAALVCEALLAALEPGSVIVVDLSRLHSVEREAQGVLAFLMQQALRVADSTVIVVAAPRLREVLAATFMRRLFEDPAVIVCATVERALVLADAHRREG